MLCSEQELYGSSVQNVSFLLRRAIFKHFSLISAILSCNRFSLYFVETRRFVNYRCKTRKCWTSFVEELLKQAPAASTRWRLLGVWCWVFHFRTQSVRWAYVSYYVKLKCTCRCYNELHPLASISFLDFTSRESHSLHCFIDSFHISFGQIGKQMSNVLPLLCVTEIFRTFHQIECEAMTKCQLEYVFIFVVEVSWTIWNDAFLHGYRNKCQ